MWCGAEDDGGRWGVVALRSSRGSRRGSGGSAGGGGVVVEPIEERVQLVRTLSEEEWDKVNEGQWKTTCSLSWREYGWKNIVRYFITPTQQKSQDTRRWRLCGENKANHFHIFWGCPCIIPFWQELKKSMETILKVQIPLSFEVLYLGKENQEIKYIFRIMVVVAKKAITRKWLKKDPPKIEDWVDVMLDIYRMEKLTFSARLKSETFKNYWENWIDFVSPLRVDFVQ